MANPDLINATSCILQTLGGAVGTTDTTVLSSTTHKMKKVVSVYFCNTSASTVTVDFYNANPGTDYYYVKDVDIPAKSTLVVVTKDSPIHFSDTTHSLVAIANATGVTYALAYEEYDDA